MGKKKVAASFAVVLKPKGPAQTPKKKGPAQTPPKKKKGSANTPSRMDRIYERDKGLCFWCGRKVVLRHPSRKVMATKDHLMPRSKGGGNDIDNLVLSCGPCNSNKSNHLINPVTKQPISPRVLSVFLKV